MDVSILFSFSLPNQVSQAPEMASKWPGLSSLSASTSVSVPVSVPVRQDGRSLPSPPQNWIKVPYHMNSISGFVGVGGSLLPLSL